MLFGCDQRASILVSTQAARKFRRASPMQCKSYYLKDPSERRCGLSIPFWKLATPPGALQWSFIALTWPRLLAAGKQPCVQIDFHYDIGCSRILSSTLSRSFYSCFEGYGIIPKSTFPASYELGLQLHPSWSLNRKLLANGTVTLQYDPNISYRPSPFLLVYHLA